MRLNIDTKIIGNKVVLVPYRRSHVQKYHEWMENIELREQTASERLTLEEEYKMQEAWLQDEDKCTFIVLDRETYDNTKMDEVQSMIGDVNLFLNDVDDRQRAEIEVMIAECKSRGKGFGRESVLAMMTYGVMYLNITQFSAKIGYSNLTSLSLFKSLSFTEVSRSDVFQEVTMKLDVVDQVKDLLLKRMDYLQIINESTE